MPASRPCCRRGVEHSRRTDDHDPHFPEWTGDITDLERRAQTT